MSVSSFLKGKLQEQMAGSLWDFCQATNIVTRMRVKPHAEMFAFIDRFDYNPRRRTQHKGLLLAPRYSFKSSAVIGKIVQMICLHPDIKIALFRANRNLAMGMLREIKSILTTNPVILSIYGDMSRNAEKWSETEIVVNRRTKPDRDPTVTTAGIEVSTTGMHPDAVFCDDLVVFENCDSPSEMQRAMGLIYSTFPLLPPHGGLLVSGTKWSGIDCYSRIIEENARAREAGNEPAFEEYIRSVYTKDAGGETQLYFPEELSQEFLDQQRKTLPPRWFASWYLQSTYEEGLKPFDKIVFFDGEYSAGAVNSIVLAEQGRKVPVEVVATLDTALTANRRSDRFGCCVTAKDAKDTWYVLAAHEFLKLPSEVTFDIVDVLATYEPAILLIESANADVAMVSRLQEAIRTIGVRTRIESYSALQDEERGRRGKARRIEALEPRSRMGKLLVRKGSCSALVRQMDLYPALEHDDVIDALAMTHKAMDLVPTPEETFEDAARSDWYSGKEPKDPWHERILAMQPERAEQGKPRTWTGPHGTA